MIKNIFGIFCSIWVVMLSGCDTDSNDYDHIGHNEYIQLNFTKTETRANLDESGSGSFNDGDRIGLYIDNGAEVQYRELIFEDNEWHPRLKRQEFGPG